METRNTMSGEPFEHEDKSWDWALEKIANTQGRLDRALALLREVEWVRDDDDLDLPCEVKDVAATNIIDGDTTFRFCPCCKGVHEDDTDMNGQPHERDCKLKALLEETDHE